MEQAEDYEKIALQLAFKAQKKFKVTPNTAVDICVDKIDFMIFYNPCPVNPSMDKKAYHDHWDNVRKELILLRDYVVS